MLGTCRFRLLVWKGFFQKLMNTKAKLWDLNIKVVYGNIFQRVTEMEQLFKQREEEYDTLWNKESKLSRREAQASHARTLSIECDFWRQKVAIKWLKSGDTNTKFFHAAVKQRRNANFLS